MSEETTEASRRWAAIRAELEKGDRETLEKAAEERTLSDICRVFVTSMTAGYIREHYGKPMADQAREIFKKELHDTLAAMRFYSKKEAAERFEGFLEQGCEALIGEHRVSRDRWSREVCTSVVTVLRGESVPQPMLRELRRDETLSGQLYGSAEQVLKELYQIQVREYSIRSLRKAVSNCSPLRKALDRAEAGFDITAKYARQALLDYIPDDPAYLYPAARTTERHFILHIGPTNSGKTYAALQAMRHAQDGVYLAPLRLLAYEQFDSMNKDGVRCSLKTGEERVSVPGATVVSATIEMMDERHFYDVAVIDEAQMVSDPMRGGHWTKAILGVWAKEVHICLAPEAEEIVVRMVERCGDTCEIIRHERFNELVPDAAGHVRFPESVQEGDAYIVFSRSSVHACAAELQKRGIATSIIYGALPYDVRQNEARRFREGETKVVVATDAIGMGLNLPIRRVVFLETEKFDGIGKRELTAAEYKQIAGRAGRYGQYERGLYVSPYHMSRVTRAVGEPVAPIRYADLPFPDALLGVDAPLSKIFRMWASSPNSEGYRKADMSREIRLAELLEKVSSDKELICLLVTMPFDEQRPSVFELWRALAFDAIRRREPRLKDHIPDIGSLCKDADLKELEDRYREYDLLYYFAERFQPELSQRLIDERKLVSARLMQLLATSKLPTRACRQCRRPLPWNSPYGLCSKCFDALNGGYAAYGGGRTGRR